ncbi:MAG: hypothetical protein ACTSRW_05740 [Candidatus Helarchaeota archaeon]
MPHNFSELPDDVETKLAMPLYNHIWPVFKELGWEFYEHSVKTLTDLIYDLLKVRLDEAILVSKKVIDGALPQPDKTMCFMLHPPIVPTRTDLMQGTMKLLYGDSLDCSFQLVDDFKKEMLFIFNAHLEDGIPVDWWIVGQNDDVMERRHMKSGVKIKDIPKKEKTFKKAGIRVIEALEDVRNERTPQWGTSPYLGSISWITTAVNITFETSCWENHALFWDAVNAKEKYGLKEFLAGFTPWPPLLRTMFGMPRPKYCLRGAGLFSDLQLFITTLHENAREWLKNDFPELWRIGYIEQFAKGIPLPAATMECKTTNTKDKKFFENVEFDERWEWKYPKHTRIMLEDLGIDSVDEALNGILLDITHHDGLEADISPKRIISQGMGENTVFRD